jgi:hypothetical protein
VSSTRVVSSQSRAGDWQRRVFEPYFNGSRLPIITVRVGSLSDAPPRQCQKDQPDAIVLLRGDAAVTQAEYVGSADDWDRRLGPSPILTYPRLYEESPAAFGRPE